MPSAPGKPFERTGLLPTSSRTAGRYFSAHATQASLLFAATSLAIMLLGYHPYAEDGGIYTAAVQGHLHPDLFPHDRGWVTAHTRFALFVPFVSAVVRFFHVSPATALFILFAAGLFALLASAAHLARTCFPLQRQPWLAVVAMACAAGLPVAGTGLYAADPYCTARSLTTPLLLFALSYALRRRWAPVALCWAAAATLHPLMAIWGALPVLFLLCMEARHPRQWMLGLTSITLLAASLLFAFSPAETSATRAVAHTRAYWFPAQWRWFEWAGAIAPCALLGLAAKRAGVHSGSALRRLAISATAASALAVVLAIAFVREGAPSLAVARLQPLRTVHLVFVAFLAAGAAFLQTRIRTVPQALSAMIVCAAIGISTFTMQRSLFPDTSHLEWPETTSANPWEAAFAWCRDHTPPSALFALDSNYIDQPGEDSHGFRALALRSVLPDNVKDAGIAAVLPGLALDWQAGVRATAGLNGTTDAERSDRLVALGVTWIILPSSANTTLPCPFHNAAVRVCQLIR